MIVVVPDDFWYGVPDKYHVVNSVPEQGWAESFIYKTLTLKVYDQFGKALHSVYNGSAVLERLTNMRGTSVRPSAQLPQLPPGWVPIVLPQGTVLGNGEMADDTGHVYRLEGSFPPEVLQDFLAGKFSFFTLLGLELDYRIDTELKVCGHVLKKGGTEPRKVTRHIVGHDALDGEPPNIYKITSFQITPEEP